MKAMLHAVSFFLVCVLAYYIAIVHQKKEEELSLGQHSESSHSSTPAPEEEPSQSLQDVVKAPEHDADVPVEEAQEEERRQPNPLARGWGEDIDWVETYEEGLSMAKSSQKPLMVIHHLEDCPMCKDLKAAFSGHEEIQRLAKEELIMFNLMHETNDINLAPDGYYVPRIIFIDPSMVIRAELNRNGETYRYSYTVNDMQLLLENMKKAKIPVNVPEL